MERGPDDFCRSRYDDWPDVPTRLLMALNRAPVLSEFLLSKYPRVNREGSLTRARIDVLVLIAQGYRNNEIAEALGVSQSATRDRMKRIMAVLRARNASHAVKIAHDRNLLEEVPPGKIRTVPNVSHAYDWTPKRLLALRLASHGYSQKEIALMTGCNPLSVKDRLRCAHDLLGAVNAPNAVHRGHLAGVLKTKEASSCP